MTDKTKILEKLYALIYKIQKQLKDSLIPEMNIKSRSKSNINLDEQGYWSIGNDKFVKKTLKTKGGSKQLLRLVHTLAYLIEQAESGRSSNLREFYYNALNWISEAQFEKVNDSNLCLENVQILVGLIREQLGMYPNQQGRISGPIVLEYTTRKGEKRVIDCLKDIGSSGFMLPRSIDQMKVLSTSAKFILVVQTAGLHSRLMEEGFDEKNQCLIVCTGGYSSRMTRKFLKLMRTQYGLKSAIFTDGDIHGFRIAATVISGAVKSSHLSKLLCVPDAVHIGLFPSQISEYKLPTDNITKLEKEQAELMINQTRFQPWHKEIQIMLATGKKAEQQAFSFFGLGAISEFYLPNILKNFGFL